jgi:hypothetical protein
MVKSNAGGSSAPKHPSEDPMVTPPRHSSENLSHDAGIRHLPRSSPRCPRAATSIAKQTLRQSDRRENQIEEQSTQRRWRRIHLVGEVPGFRPINHPYMFRVWTICDPSPCISLYHDHLRLLPSSPS